MPAVWPSYSCQSFCFASWVVRCLPFRFKFAWVSSWFSWKPLRPPRTPKLWRPVARWKAFRAWKIIHWARLVFTCDWTVLAGSSTCEVPNNTLSCCWLPFPKLLVILVFSFRKLNRSITFCQARFPSRLVTFWAVQSHWAMRAPFQCSRRVPRSPN